MPSGSVRAPGGATTLPTPVWTASTPARVIRAQSRIVVGTDSADTTSPLTVFVSESRSKVSLVAGFDSTIVWTANEDCQAWQIREVADAATALGAAGLLVASGGAVPAGVEQQTVIGGASLTAGDGARLLKIFAQDLAGNWTA